MATKTKAEHLVELVDEFMPKADFTPWFYGYLKNLAEARAERDAALAKAEQLGQRMPDDALLGSLAAELDCSPFETLATLVRCARDRIFELKEDQPSPAPVDGGVTEEMLDKLFAIAVNRVESPAYMLVREWIDAARAAIRAQKRVDVEAIRKVAESLPIGFGLTRSAILRAIGDVPPEATSALQADGFSIKMGDTFTAPFVNLSRTPQAEPTVYVTPETPHDLVIQTTPAPAEAEGPYQASGLNLWNRATPLAWCNSHADLDELVRKLNLGHAAEQGKLVKPPATREEMLVALVDLAVLLGDRNPIWHLGLNIFVPANDAEREVLRAHIAKKQEAKS